MGDAARRAGGGGGGVVGVTRRVKRVSEWVRWARVERRLDVRDVAVYAGSVSGALYGLRGGGKWYGGDLPLFVSVFDRGP